MSLFKNSKIKKKTIIKKLNKKTPLVYIYKGEKINAVHIRSASLYVYACVRA
jgi:hypothetical protein